MFEIQGKQYEIMINNKDAFQETVVRDRYSDILLKYDFIIGDWGYDQLRLKGFYADHNPKASYDTKISSLDDYLYEHCNFGCAYFVLRRIYK